MKEHLLCPKRLETRGPTTRVASAGAVAAAAPDRFPWSTMKNQNSRDISSHLSRMVLLTSYAVWWSLTVRNEERGENAGRPTHTTKMESIQVLEECQNPTSDEVLSWSQNFDKMMKAPAGRNLFREFLRTEYSEENLLFWLACEDLKKEQNKKVIEEKARMIYEDYISILSPKENSLLCKQQIRRRKEKKSTKQFEDILSQ
ncbi:regulator of G-protein signaling 17 isoform X4 [Canis lupus baileyi]|uniref:regulator of G-protein signaling 17 isoform X3 n=1 Tax=Canis lupus dingo TaxID=286419 RepID=UPI0020C29558|nr:regulator of G-protein signaling 17 isoform X3 [Canis lupus dingo]